jgi:plasmid stabilization system protein ParE
MAYRVKLTAPAEADAYSAFERIREEAPDHAERWLLKLFEALFSLAEMPRRCLLIPEAEKIGKEIRHLLYGRRSGVYRILFDIQEDSDEGPLVRVLRIWHGSRDQIRREDLEERVG